jgi:hypothetical protein
MAGRRQTPPQAEPPVPVPMHTTTVRFPEDDYEALKTYAFIANTSVNEVLHRVVRSFLREHATAEALDAMIKRQRAQFRRTVDGMGPD